MVSFFHSFTLVRYDLLIISYFTLQLTSHVVFIELIYLKHNFVHIACDATFPYVDVSLTRKIQDTISRVQAKFNRTNINLAIVVYPVNCFERSVYVYVTYNMSIDAISRNSLGTQNSVISGLTLCMNFSVTVPLSPYIAKFS